VVVLEPASSGLGRALLGRGRLLCRDGLGGWPDDERGGGRNCAFDAAAGSDSNNAGGGFLSVRFFGRGAGALFEDVTTGCSISEKTHADVRSLLTLPQIIGKQEGTPTRTTNSKLQTGATAEPADNAAGA